MASQVDKNSPSYLGPRAQPVATHKRYLLANVKESSWRSWLWRKSFPLPVRSKPNASHPPYQQHEI